MSNKTRNIIKVVAVVMVLLVVMMHMGWLVGFIAPYYRFWLVVIAFGLVLVTGR
jgi:putative Mn2+ efflux pump MntP